MNATRKSQRDERVGMPSPYHDIAIKSSPSAKKAREQLDNSNQGNNMIDISSSSSLPKSSGDATFSEDDEEVQFVPRYMLPCGTYLTGTLKKKVEEKVRAIHSEIPTHVCVMTKSNVYGRSRCMNMDKNCKICMEWQEHCYWSHMADDKKHFFKPMVGDFTETMSIPARFANNFNGHISEVVSLKSPSGKTWSIGVANDTDVVVLQSGWKEFVSAHSIAEGNYLLFKYTGVSSFDVLIFDSSGCEKTSPHFAKNHGYERIEGSAGVEGARHDSHKFKAGKDCTPQLVPSGDDEDDDDDDMELAVLKNTSRSIPKPCKLKHYLDIEQAHCQVKIDEDDLEVDEGDAPAKTGYYFCKNGPVSGYHLTEEDREEISSIRIPAQSTNPVFVQVMHPSHVRGKKSGVVAISSEFAAKYLGATRGDIILRRASSKGKWHVRYNINKFCRGLTGRGWCGFVGDNGLLDHDVCLFELMMGKQRPTMTVHVMRKVRGRFVLLR
ncbi:B3 domain-containing protein [Dichanthelium oligosanthes]|uniref:B3 domain-containing protein n=1 Tax=Dichanthelium oligosanthes TaxID=888268 RepID=A0A1E5WJT8_9POAL|nr:B3 domain-containing protein [Dichanthelium oligosanthes]